MINVARFIFNPFKENTYVVWDGTQQCVIIDAGNNFEQENNSLLNFIAEKGLKPMAAISTHGHYDHVCGVGLLKEKFGIPFALSSVDEYVYSTAAFDGARYRFKFKTEKYEIDLSKQKTFSFGETEFKIIPTPGHTTGHVCFYDEVSKIMFTGDTLFKESIGRTDLRGGDYEAIMDSILTKILPLGGDIVFYSGHGPESTIGHETMYNPFITEVLQGGFNVDSEEQQ